MRTYYVIESYSDFILSVNHFRSKEEAEACFRKLLTEFDDTFEIPIEKRPTYSDEYIEECIKRDIHLDAYDNGHRIHIFTKIDNK